MPVFHQIFDLDRNTNALGVCQYAYIDFVQSNEKSDGQSDAQSLCGIAFRIPYKVCRLAMYAVSGHFMSHSGVCLHIFRQSTQKNLDI